MTHTPHHPGPHPGPHPAPHVPKNPYAQLWQDAERRLRDQINTVHALGVDVDSTRRGLNWQGAGEQHFQHLAAARHRDLHQHNDLLRTLLTQVQAAAEMKPQPVAHPMGGAA